MRLGPLNKLLEGIMTTITHFVLDIPEARDLENLSGVESDLFILIEQCEMYLKLHNGSPSAEDSKILEPLCLSILVYFVRALSSGVRRQGTENILDELDEHKSERYQYYKDIRDKHFVHSVNEMEKHTVHANYILEKPERGILSISHGGHRTVYLSPNNIREIKEISEVFKEIVEKRIEKEQIKLLEIAKQRIKPEDFHKYSMQAAKPLAEVNVAKSRQKINF